MLAVLDKVLWLHSDAKAMVYSLHSCVEMDTSIRSHLRCYHW